MAALTGKVIVSALLALSLLVPVWGAGNNLHSAGNDQFEIIGLDGRSVSCVQDLSRHIVKVAERYLDRKDLEFPQRILVSLKPQDYVDFEGDYIVRAGTRGFVNLDLRWEESLSLLTTCRALSEALLLRYSIFNYGEVGPDSLPKWPSTAIGTKAYLILRPAQSGRFSDWLELEATPTVEAVLQRKWTDQVEDYNGFAFLLAMEQGGLERKAIRKLMAQSLSGENISDRLVSLVQLNDPASGNLELDDWWRASFAQILTPVDEVMETIESSRLWIEALSDLSNSGYEDLNLVQLWDERENEALRELINARYEILRLRIVRVNPAYFNAARSLGALFETYLNGDKRHKYVRRLTGFLGDFEDSKLLEERVAEALVQAGAEGLGE